jgi:hypothetical protein
MPRATNAAIACALGPQRMHIYTLLRGENADSSHVISDLCGAASKTSSAEDAIRTELSVSTVDCPDLSVQVDDVRGVVKELQ